MVQVESGSGSQGYNERLLFHKINTLDDDNYERGKRRQPDAEKLKVDLFHADKNLRNEHLRIQELKAKVSGLEKA